MRPPLGDIIGRKLNHGRLPLRDPVKTWTGWGWGARCGGCDAPIFPSERVYRLMFGGGGRSYHLHVACWWLWETERRRRNASTAGRDDPPMAPKIGEIILRKLDDGLLPILDPVKTREGYGRGRRCDACDAPILPAQHEYELEYKDSKSYYLHLGCFGLWEAERRRRGLAAEAVTTQREDTAALIAAGTLPMDQAVKVYAGPGNGQHRCDASVA